MRILFIHENFPAQFGAFGEHVAQLGWDASFATMRKDARSGAMRILRFGRKRDPRPETHLYLRGFEKAVLTGQGFARAAVSLRRDGYIPDVVMAHSGWGVGSFAKDVWPETRFVPYFEWHYSWPNPDRTRYDPPADPLDARARNRVRNAPFWLDFSSADVAICPTRFQASQFPDRLRRDLTIIHDGVDVDLHAPGDAAPGRAALGLPEGAELITSITRGMEPHRGFPETMRALALLQKRRPNLHAAIGGEDRAAYGAKLPEGESWKKRMLAELDLDLSRVHFTGLLPRARMIELMRASDAHIYLTVPFVASWSLLDAMACGCLIVGSDTEPVREFVRDGREGLLAPLDDPEALAARIEAALDAREGAAPLRRAARARIVERYDARRVIWPRKVAMLEDLVAGRPVPRGEAAPA